MTTKIDTDEVRRLLRLLRNEPEPDPMQERLVEMFREWKKAGRPRETRAGKGGLRIVERDLEGS